MELKFTSMPFQCLDCNFVVTTSSGRICCLNIWSRNLTSLEMLEAADCDLTGDIYSMSIENIELYGSALAEISAHPEKSSLQGKYKTH